MTSSVSSSSLVLTNNDVIAFAFHIALMMIKQNKATFPLSRSCFTHDDVIIRHTDAIYVLAFATIMLHTDAHNPTIKKKMTKQEWLKYVPREREREAREQVRTRKRLRARENEEERKREMRVKVNPYAINSTPKKKRTPHLWYALAFSFSFSID